MTTNAELIAEAVEDALFCWAGEGPPDAQFIASRVTDALESATTVTDEMVERASRAFYNDPIGLTNWDSLVKTSPEIAERYRVSVLRALTAALTEGERR